MKTALTVTAMLVLALSLGGQPNPTNAEIKKFNSGPITTVPVNSDLAISNVVAYRCLCTLDASYLEELGALYMVGVKK